jgi:hypothetical protein
VLVLLLLKNGWLIADVSFVKMSNARTRKLLMVQIEGIALMSYRFEYQKEIWSIRGSWIQEIELAWTAARYEATLSSW